MKLVYIVQIQNIALPLQFTQSIYRNQATKAAITELCLLLSKKKKTLHMPPYFLF